MGQIFHCVKNTLLNVTCHFVGSHHLPHLRYKHTSQINVYYSHAVTDLLFTDKFLPYEQVTSTIKTNIAVIQWNVDVVYTRVRTIVNLSLIHI